jgi:hypothetical protein
MEIWKYKKNPTENKLPEYCLFSTHKMLFRVVPHETDLRGHIPVTNGKELSPSVYKTYTTFLMDYCKEIKEETKENLKCIQQ